ncbi:Nn.00g090570.m01.CDS01 [Neocucurbitaria sp. VM-36]
MDSSSEVVAPHDTAATPLTTSTHGLAPANISAAANISIREYIYFLPYPLPTGTPIPYSIGLPNNNPLNLPPHQFEPTSTLVLTSPNHTFVDIRLFKPFDTSANTLSPNKGERERLEWAFAGISESRPITDKRSTKTGDEEKHWEGVTHSTWTHWLDSRHSVGDPTIPIDEGDMYPIADDLTLEHGHAFQPLMRAHKTHEEMWRDVAAQSTNSAGTKICVVLRVQADTAGVRGVIIRLGQYCQGIVMQRDYCTVERWEFVDEGKRDVEEAARWKRTARVGDQELPCAATFRPEVLAVGGVVKYHDYEWVVEEVWEWK